MPITLQMRDDLSINDIIALGKNHVVKVTPHVGNWTPARLVLPQLGISILCIDHTIGNKDRNAHPHLLIQEGEALELCEQHDLLTTHASVTRQVNGGAHPVGKSLSDVHIGTIRSLYPGADIVTHSEYLQEYRDLTLAVLEEATAYSRTATWWRKVDSCGNVTCHKKKDLPRSWKDVESYIYALTDKQEGWLVHNRISILMDAIIQSRMGTEHEIYHLSGPDMVRYLGGEIEVISNLYDFVRKKLDLPRDQLTFNLVPFASFRFATRGDQASACEKLCDALAGGQSDEQVLRSYVREAFDVLAESETKQYLTQHDCVSKGVRIIVPEIARDWSMATCAEHMRKARAVQ